MSVSNAGPGGVRNLRAMFENKASDQSTSPPSRGRSPNGSISSVHDRPLSKVRASFVAVEKVGEEESSQPGRNEASDLRMDGARDSAISDDQSLGGILKGSPFLDEGEFSSEAAQSTYSNGVVDRAAAMVRKMQQGNADVPAPSDPAKVGTEMEKNEIESQQSKSKSPAAGSSSINANQPSTTAKGPIAKPRGGVNKIKGVMESAARARAEGQVPVDDGKPTEEDKKYDDAGDHANRTKTGRVSTVHEIKPKGGVSKIQGVMESAKRAREAREAREAQAPNPSQSAANGVVSRESGKSQPTIRAPRASLNTSKLPAAATASTASSVAKKEDSRSAETKPSDKQNIKVPARAASTTTSSLVKKPSRVSMSANDGNKSKSSMRSADEGFLARMTRPTASSAQKAHDKVQVSSPPRIRQLPGKGLSTKGSRKSLSQADENKENETEVPAVPAVSQEAGDKLESISPQPAEEASSN